jgi:hypothetical protein
LHGLINIDPLCIDLLHSKGASVLTPLDFFAALSRIKERDINHDGTVSFEEFVASYGAIIQPARVTTDGTTGDVHVLVEDDHLTVDAR